MIELLVQVGTAQDQLLPKKKFAFKSRPKKSAPAKSSTDPTPPPPPPPADAVSTQNSPLGHQNLTGFSSKENEVLSLPVSLYTTCFV